MHLHQPTKRDQSGFSTVEIVLVVIVAAVIIAAGSFVAYRYHHKNVSTKSSAATGSSQTATQPQSTTTTQTQQPAAQYLDIKEWGVKMPLSATIKTAYYDVGKGSSYSPGGLPSTMWLGLASLSGASCNPSNNDSGQRGALGALLRVSPTDTDPVSGQLLTQKYPNGQTVNGWYYAYQSWAANNPCASSATLQPIDSAFATAIKSAVTATTN